MRLRHAAVAGLVLSLVTTACSSTMAEEEVELSADELAAMAFPGVDETALDRSVDPCDDFYAFACGNYIASLPADTQRETRGFSQLQRERDATLGQVIEELRRAPRSAAERNAVAFYESCMSDEGVGGAETQAFLRGRRAEIDSAASGADIARVIARLHRSGVETFFVVFPKPDTEVRGRHGGAMALPAGYHSPTNYADDESRAARTKALETSVLIAEPGAGAEALRIAEAAVRVEQALAAAAAAISDDEPMHLVGRHGLEFAAPGFDWSSYFGVFSSDQLGSFPVQGLGYFASLDEILRATSLADVQTYLVARWYEAMTWDAVASSDTRASTCREALSWSMSDALEPLFLERAGVDARSRAKANVLWRAITDAFDEQLREPSFLDVPTRVEARVKLAKMRAAIGGSHHLDDFSDLSFDADASFLAMQTRIRERAFDKQLASIGQALDLLHLDFPAPHVNASYDGSLNRITVPGGILGGYMFSSAASNLANFAGIGVVFGHELTHGFDTRGRMLDGEGLERDWWSPEVDATFRERSSCMIDQYGAFTLEGVVDPVSGKSPAHVNGRRTIGENIADNGAVKTAYRAANVEGRTGPVTAGFTPAQQFFVGYGQIWCAKVAPEVASQLLAFPHSPAKARVNLPLANFDKFAAAFQCKPGRRMAPAQRCSVW